MTPPTQLLALPSRRAAIGLGLVLAMACSRDPVASDGTDATTMDTMGTMGTMGTTDTSPGTGVFDSTGVEPDTGVDPDTTGSPDMGVPPSCAKGESCGALDLLIVIDNSGTMGEMQLGLARSFEALVTQLEGLVDLQGNELRPDVRIMVTTTDMGHPLCTAFFKPDYTPAQGSPIYTGCNVRINRFTGLDPMNPIIIEEACTENCPVDVAPSGHFIEFGPGGSNVPGDDVATALACIGPQGIDGCGYESPLESMLQALEPAACWNDPEQQTCQDTEEWAGVTEGFLRDDAVLAVVLVTDELDCSVLAPDGYSYFIDVANTVYWNVNPAIGVPQATSAICFNAGVTCSDAEGDGVYEGCSSADNGVLHPVERYTSLLQSLSRTREVTMLTLVGAPPVLEHAADPPYEPTAGGIADAVYRDWIDGEYPAGDILPEQWANGRTAAHKRFEFGALGPGCFGQNDAGEFTIQALPPVRTREVCESLDGVDPDTGEPVVRCCIESICDSDYEPAFRCLSGTVAQALSD